MNELKEVEGKTLVQVKVPVCITILMDDGDAEDMSKWELCGLIDEAIDEFAKGGTMVSFDGVWMSPRSRMQHIPVDIRLSRSWDELPVDECELTLVDAGLFEETTED